MAIDGEKCANGMGAKRRGTAGPFFIASSVLLLIVCRTKGDDELCPNQTENNVSWPATDTSYCLKSQPLCITEKMEIASRCCTEGGKWEDAPTCRTVQSKIASPCPDPVHYWSKEICILIIPNTSYPPKCPYEETMSFFDYVNYVDPTLLPVWMPVERHTGNYGTGLLHWMEPTSEYGTAYMSCGDDTCTNYYFSDSVKDKNCLLYHNASHIEVASCDEEHTGICAYRSLPERTRSFCSQNFPSCMQSDYSTRSACFCKNPTASSASAFQAEFPRPYQNLIYNSLTNETCYIGLEKRADGTYAWPKRNLTADYTNWAVEAVFGGDYAYGAMSEDGWILTKTKEELACGLYELSPPVRDSLITLEYDEENRRFTVNMTNPTGWVFGEHRIPMVFCFTDAARDDLVTRVEVTGESSEQYATFTFVSSEDEPGTYWCEAFLYPTVTVARSNELLIRFPDTFTEEYVVILKTTYPAGSNPLTQAYFRSLQENLTEQISVLPNISNFVPRIYKIMAINESKSKITVNFHIANPGNSAPLSSYSTLRGYLEQNLSGFSFVNVFGVDKCVGIQMATASQTITWPVTDIHGVATKPREGYCTKSDGSIMYRHCDGNYVDGAQWADLEEACTIQQSTNVTVNLTNIIDLITNTSSSPHENIQQVSDIISNHYMELVPLDIHLISIFLEQVAADEEVDVNLTAKIIDDLLEVPKSALRESQALFNATDRILHYADKIIENSKFVGDIVGKNFMLISHYVKEANMTGIAVTNYDEEYLGMYKVFNVFEFGDILKCENVEAAIVLSEQLLTQILEYSQKSKEDKSRFVVTIFKNSNLFNEDGLDLVTTSIVIGATFPDFKEEFQGNVFTLFNHYENYHQTNCSFWDYDMVDMKKGYWQVEKEKSYNQLAIMCSYNHLTHFTVMQRAEVNVTRELEDLLAADTSIPEKLKRVSLLTEYYLEKFQPVDVWLVSCIFEEAATSPVENLDVVADIFDKIVEIPSEILEKSQFMYNATGKVLQYFEKILQQYERSQVIERDHFYAIVQLMEEEELYGLTITSCDGMAKYNLTLLYDEINDEDIAGTANLDTALILDEALIEQLLDIKEDDYTPKLVITIFLSDTIFISDTEVKTSTKIIGVSMPGFDQNLNGGINLLYSVYHDIASNYTCSVYSNDVDNNTAEKGFWNSQGSTTFVKNLLRCQFWNPKYFALVHNLINFTSSLEKMLDSEEPVDVILGTTNLILYNYHNYLKSVDIFLIAKLLSKVEEVDESVLDICVRLVGYAMYICREDLREAQMQYGATDLILYHLYRIAAKYNQSGEFYEDKVAVVVSLLAETEMYGLALQHCDSTCNITILNEDNSSNLTNLDAAVVINPNLLKQLLAAENENYVAKLVIVMFHTDALFNEGLVLRDPSRVFGVYFPNYAGSFSREFQLLFAPSSNGTSRFSCFSWSYQAQPGFDVIKGAWNYSSLARVSELALSCNLYSDGYFSLMEGYHIYDNVTDALSTILTDNVSFSEKLYRTEDTSYYYAKYTTIDIHLVSTVLNQCDMLYSDEISRLTGLINNILKISEDILVDSDETYNTLGHMLHGINKMANFVDSHQYSVITDNFGLVICHLNMSGPAGVIVTHKEVTCLTNITEIFAASERNVAGVALTGEILNMTTFPETPKMIIMVLLDNIFLVDRDSRNASIMLGISIPGYDEQAQGDIVAIFSSRMYNTTNHVCAYWNGNSNSSWNIEKDYERNESFTRCNFKQGTYLALVENVGNSNTTTLAQILIDIYLDSSTISEKLIQTQNVISLYADIFEADHVYLVVKILSQIDQVVFQDLHAVINIVNLMMSFARNVLVEAQLKYEATDWILHYVGLVAEIFGNPLELPLVTPNLALVIANDIAGVAIANCLSGCEVSNFRDIDFLATHPNMSMNAVLQLDNSLMWQIEDSESILIITVYFNDALFNEGGDSLYKNAAQVIGTTIFPEITELNGSFKFYYYKQENSTDVCAFWNYSVNEDGIIRGHWKKESEPTQLSPVSLCESKNTSHIAILEAESNVTSDLEDILNSNLTARKRLEQVATITTNVPNKLSPVDIYLIAKILDLSSEEADKEELVLATRIVSKLFHVPRSVLRESQVSYYATDRILHSIDEMAKVIDSVDGDPIVQDNFVVAVYDLKATNVSGLLMENCGTTQCNISTLENTVNLTQLAENENLETAIALSDSLLSQIQQSEGSPKLVTTVFFSDVLFNEVVEGQRNVSMICGLLLPGLEEPLNGSVFLMYNTPSEVDYNSCAYWNYNVTGGDQMVGGVWKEDADPITKKRFAICQFDHTTHFALLLANGNNSLSDADKYRILDIMTDINCMLSLIGILGILLTAALFERWRRNTGNQILVNFVVAISIKIVMLYVSVAVYSEHVADVGCSVTGAILHYAILSEFCWMLIIAILQFKRFVEVLGGPPKYILLKACICGWVFPVLPVTLILLVDADNYSEGQMGLCYPSGLGLYLGIWLPLIIIITINFVIFIFIIYNVFHKKTETRDLVNHEILFQWRLALLLFSMLGLTWLFGFLGLINGATIFIYLFCFTSTLQGFIMFLFFIVFNKSTRFLYAQAIKMWLYTKGYKMQ